MRGLSRARRIAAAHRRRHSAAPRQDGRAMNRAAVLRHLVEIVGPDGAVPSWVSARHPGFAYPEAAAIVLRLLAQEPDPPRATMDRLIRFVRSQPAGKDGRVYTFD